MKCEKLQRVLQFIILSNFPGSALSHEGNTERQRMMRREREKKEIKTSPCRCLNRFMKLQRQAESLFEHGNRSESNSF